MEKLYINGLPLEIKEYKGQRVVTFKDIDTVHGRPEGTARRNFNKNRKHFIEGEDFFKVCAYEIRTHKILDISPKAHDDVTLLTESGYLMIVKSFTDDLAWSVQRELVNTYFRAKEISVSYERICNELKEIVNEFLDEKIKNEIDSALNEKTDDIIKTLIPCFYLLDTKINTLQKDSCNIEKTVSALKAYTEISELSGQTKNKIEFQTSASENTLLVFEFIEECCERRCGTRNNVTTADLYRAFETWCLMKNTNAVSKPIFINQICEYFQTDDKRNIRKNVAGRWYYLITLTPVAMKKLNV